MQLTLLHDPFLQQILRTFIPKVKFLIKMMAYAWWIRIRKCVAKIRLYRNLVAWLTKAKHQSSWSSNPNSRTIIALQRPREWTKVETKVALIILHKTAIRIRVAILKRDKIQAKRSSMRRLRITTKVTVVFKMSLITNWGSTKSQLDWMMF